LKDAAMPVALSYPGVYIEENTTPGSAIVGVSTSLTAFIGRALRGPVSQPTLVESFADFTRQFGGLWAASALGYSVVQFFANGGSQALIVRVHNGATSATATLTNGGTGITLEAASPGQWGRNLTAVVTASQVSSTTLFNLKLTDSGGGASETYLNLSTDPTSATFIGQVLAQQSQLAVTNNMTWSPSVAIPTAQTRTFAGSPSDGSDIGDAQVSDPSLQANKQGLWALDHVPLFNLLVIPPYERLPGAAKPDVDSATWTAAAQYVASRRAFLIVDAPSSWSSVSNAETDAQSMLSNVLSSGTYADSAAIYFPYVLAPDPLLQNLLMPFAPSGMIAGIYANTDAQRGVWKAPAGISASLSGAVGLTAPGSNGAPLALNDGDSGQLNPLGVNCLRNFPVIGNVVWGARTMAGADALASPWKYVPIRRLARYIEQSLFQGTQWVVFEPNAAPLWSQIRLDVGAFMQELFGQGAFAGSSPAQAYFVQCDATTTTPTDAANGIVNIIVGFAPLYPAEFVVIQIQQISPLASS
jgi:phage tail sheath protein FI